MFKHKRLLTVLACAALALLLGAAAFFIPSTTVQAHDGPGGHGECIGFHESDTYLALALGITPEQLAAAREAAWDKIVDQALANGLITEAQAAELKESGYGFHGRKGGLASWLISEANVDYEAALAAELGLTPEALAAAREAAREMQIQAALDAGQITPEEADALRTRLAMRTYIDRETMLANALGITVEELRTARQNGTDLTDLLASLGLDETTVAASLQAQVEAAVKQAMADGKITQEQADAYLADPHNYNLEDFYHSLPVVTYDLNRLFDLEDYIDPVEMLAAALGIPVEDLATSYHEGHTLSELIASLGLTEEAVLANLKTALAPALQQAVTDGVITQAQADWYLENVTLQSFSDRHDRGWHGMNPKRNPNEQDGQDDQDEQDNHNDHGHQDDGGHQQNGQHHSGDGHSNNGGHHDRGNSRP